MATADRPTLTFPDTAAVREWLEANHTVSDGMWMRIAKKGSSHSTVAIADVLEQMLCFGWIDGQRKALDDDFFLQAYSPRRARSPWSQRNIGIVTELIERGLMTPAGHAEIERAKTDGRWDRAYGGSDSAPPADFLAALAENPAAQEFYNTLNKQNRFAVYFRLQDAVRPQTRARRIAKFIDMFAKGEKFH